MSTVAEKVRSFIEGIATDAVEERVVEYVIREVHNGRKLSEVMADPYVKNRLNEEKLRKVLENPAIVGAIEEAIANSFQKRDFGFTS